MKKDLAFIILVMIIPIIKVIYYSGKLAIWINNIAFYCGDKLFYYVYEEHPHEDGDWN